VRHYVTPEGNQYPYQYPSVTTILKASEGDWLKEWKERVGEKKAAEVSTKATLQGNMLHDMMERYLGNKSPSAPRIRLSRRNFIRDRIWLATFHMRIHMERVPLTSYSACGMIDLWAGNERRTNANNGI